MKFDKKKYVFGFICENKNHWTCFYVHLDSSIVYYINPQGEKQAQKNKFFKNWKKFSSSNKYLSPRTSTPLDRSLNGEFLDVPDLFDFNYKAYDLRHLNEELSQKLKEIRNKNDAIEVLLNEIIFLKHDYGQKLKMHKTEKEYLEIALRKKSTDLDSIKKEYESNEIDQNKIYSELEVKLRET